VKALPGVLGALLAAGLVASVAAAYGAGGSATRSAGSVLVADGPLAWSPSRDELAVTASVNGLDAIYVVRPDGSRPRQVTPKVDPDSRARGAVAPVWTQDGNRLAFISEDTQSPNGTTLVRVIGRDGTGLKTVAAGFAPSWAPDGRHLVFSGFDPTGSPFGLEVADTRTGTVRQLVAWGTDAPQWQPHGSLVAFAAACGGPRCPIFVANGNDGTRRRIAVGTDPAWSSDGRLLAFLTGGSLCVIHLDGAGRHCIGHSPAEAPSGVAPVLWAPHRALLAILVDQGGYSDWGGYVIDVTTGRQKRVLSPARASQADGPFWSRDGHTLAFVTRSHRIFIGHSDGSNGHYLDLQTQ
jgi:Tol biopolymer transport system component